MGNANPPPADTGRARTRCGRATMDEKWDILL
jgi:hypothetical protein